MTARKALERALFHIKVRAAEEIAMPMEADPAEDQARIYERASNILDEITFLAEIALERAKSEPEAQEDPIGYAVGQANVRDRIVNELRLQQSRVGGEAYNTIGAILRSIEKMGLPSQQEFTPTLQGQVDAVKEASQSFLMRGDHKCTTCAEVVLQRDLRGENNDLHWSIAKAEWCGPVIPLRIVTLGAAAIVSERYRQINVEGWTAEHDAKWEKGELVKAAMCYCAEPNEADKHNPGLIDAARYRPGIWWPWPIEWFKPKDRTRNLVRAGALIAAEIDRLNRIQRKEVKP